MTRRIGRFKVEHLALFVPTILAELLSNGEHTVREHWTRCQNWTCSDESKHLLSCYHPWEDRVLFVFWIAWAISRTIPQQDLAWFSATLLPGITLKHLSLYRFMIS